jgi:precorrin-6B methylase 2
MTYQNLFPIQAMAKEAGRSLKFLQWARQQLNIQPYQHLLEIGYGTGQLMEEVARTLRIGFIAGIESSISLYQQAYRRNRRFVRQQLVQLHIGEPYELSYPSHYFHTVYGTNIHLSSKDIHSELLRLSGLLKSRGRLVLLLETGRSRFNIHETASLLQEACRSSGLIRISTEAHPSNPDNCLSISALKP